MARDEGSGTARRKNPPREPTRKSTSLPPRPPLSKAQKAKGKRVAPPESSSSDDTTHSDAEEAPEMTIAPWPRPDGAPFEHNLPVQMGENITFGKLKNSTKYRERGPDEPWCVANSVFYNGWLRINFKPARVISVDVFRKMGMLDDITTFLRRVGLGTLPYQSYDLHEELARQFFASVELHMRTGGHDDASDAYITFFSRGRLFQLSIPALCDVFGFDATARDCHWPTFDTTELWRLIGDLSLCSRDRKLSKIRNPVLRIATKIIGSLLLGKEETGSVTDAEMILLHYGLPPSLRSDIYSTATLRRIPGELYTNLGYKFAEMLVNKKPRGINISKAKDEYLGNLLTPIFSRCGVNLDAEPAPKKATAYFDYEYFHAAHIVDRDIRTYKYTDAEGFAKRVPLPVADLTSPSTREALRFAVQVHSGAPRRSTQHRHSQPASPPQTTTPEYIIPPYAGEYDLEHLPSGSTVEQRLDRILENQHRQQSMLTRMWGALSKVMCAGGSSARDTAGPSGETRRRRTATGEDRAREDDETDDEADRRTRARHAD